MGATGASQQAAGSKASPYYDWLYEVQPAASPEHTPVYRTKRLDGSAAGAVSAAASAAVAMPAGAGGSEPAQHGISRTAGAAAEAPAGEAPAGEAESHVSKGTGTNGYQTACATNAAASSSAAAAGAGNSRPSKASHSQQQRQELAAAGSIHALTTSFRGCTTLDQVFRAAVVEHGDRPLLGKRTVLQNGQAGPYEWQSYAEVDTCVAQLVLAMGKAGVAKGSAVGVYGSNSPQWVAAMLACNRMGAVCVPLYDTFGPGAVGHVIAHSAMVLVFAQDGKAADLAAAVQGLEQHAAGAEAENVHDDSPAAADNPGGATLPGIHTGPLVVPETVAGHAVARVVVWPSHSNSNTYTSRAACAEAGRELLGLVTASVREQLAAAGVQACSWGSFLAGGGLLGSGGSSSSSLQALLLDQPGPEPEDPCTIMYTSGTTGPPQGVVLSHRAMVSVIAAQQVVLDQVVALTGDPRDAMEAGEDAHLSYLPLAHIYERVMVETVAAMGARVGFWQGSIERVPEDILALRPAILVGVPRVWERVVASAKERIKRRGPLSRTLFGWARRRKQARMAQGWPSRAAAPLADRLVFSKVRAGLGGRIKLWISGAAQLPSHVEEWLRVSLPCPGGQGYGLTEACSASTMVLPDRHEMEGTVGVPLPCVEMRLVSVPEMGYHVGGLGPARGELCLRGPCLFSGYYKQADATREVMDADGFLLTGDIVELTPSGALRIIDRRKALLKLAQGEYVAPERVEAALRGSEVVEAVWVTGEPGCRRLVAVVVPHQDCLMRWAATQQLPGTFQDVCASAAARQHVLAQLQGCARAAGLSSLEVPHAVHLEQEEWQVGGGLLTPTAKLARHRLRQHYAEQVAEMYMGLGEVAGAAAGGR